MPIVTGSKSLETLGSRVAGLNLDTSDVDRLIEITNHKLSDILIIGVRNAGFNNRDIVMEPDLPLPKGLLDRMHDFVMYRDELDLRPILQAVLTYPYLERRLSDPVLDLLPDIFGTLLLLELRLVRIIAPEVTNPDTGTWDRVLQAMDLLL